MFALMIILGLVALTISVVSLALSFIFLYKVPRYLEKIVDQLRFCNDIFYRYYEDTVDK